MLAACTAPAFVRPTSLMPLWVPNRDLAYSSGWQWEGEFIDFAPSVESIVRAGLVRAMSKVIDQHLLACADRYGTPPELTLELQRQLKFKA